MKGIGELFWGLVAAVLVASIVLGALALALLEGSLNKI